MRFLEVVIVGGVAGALFRATWVAVRARAHGKWRQQHDRDLHALRDRLRTTTGAILAYLDSVSRNDDWLREEIDMNHKTLANTGLRHD